MVVNGIEQMGRATSKNNISYSPSQTRQLFVSKKILPTTDKMLCGKEVY